TPSSLPLHRACSDVVPQSIPSPGVAAWPGESLELAAAPGRGPDRQYVARRGSAAETLEAAPTGQRGCAPRRIAGALPPLALASGHARGGGPPPQGEAW